ncbi:MAG: glycosyltransferase family 9 protein [Gemmataceae bacterium]
MSKLRILIVRLSAIGDVVHGLPVLNALRDRFPHAHLSWVVEGRAAELLRDHPSLDELIIIPRGWLQSPSEISQLRKRLLELNPCIAIDLQGLARSAVVAWLSGAKRRLVGADGREMSRFLHTESLQPKQLHVIERNLELLQAVGIFEPSIRFDLPPFPIEAKTVNQKLKELLRHKNYAVINPGAGWPSKRWEVDRFAEVARQVGREFLLPSVVVWAGDEEKEWAEQIVAGSGGQAHLAPPTSLRELTEIIRQASLFVSSDTGPLHIAAAVETPCVGLFGPVAASRNGPYGPDHVSVQRVCLEGSSRVRRNANNDCMRAITVDDVVKACAEVLGQRLLKMSA